MIASIFPTVSSWWLTLCVIACVNLLILFVGIPRKHRARAYSQDLLRFRNLQLLFCSIYTIGCAFRSFLPASQIKRTGLVDVWLNSSGMSRSVATIAELAFVIQWALMLAEVARFTGNRSIALLSRLIVPIIFIAEIFSWYTCTTTNYIGTAIEESLWAVAAGITMLGLILARPYYSGVQRKFLSFGIPVCIGYILYMITVDIPNYLKNWKLDEAANKIYLSIPAGLKDAFTNWQATSSYELWKYEMLWMTLYFSVAVWLSFTIVMAPAWNRNLKR